MYNIPEKVIMVVATSCGLSYALVNMNMALIINYAPLLTLDIVALLMRLYYARYVELNDIEVVGENL